MNKVKEIIGNILAEFVEGFPKEYAFTGLAGMILGVLAAFGVTVSGRDQEKLAFWIFAVIAGILILNGFIKTLRNKSHASKPCALLVHVLTFILMDLLTKFLVPLAIALVVVAGIFFFLSGGNLGSIAKGLGSQQVEQPKTEEQVKVWRENGMTREYLKVNSTGDMYYDPEDGEWHKIRK